MTENWEQDSLPVYVPTITLGVADEDLDEETIPFYLRRYTKKSPFGNVHMALRIGPLMIENGVAK